MGDELHKLYMFEFLVHSVTYNNSTLKLDESFLKNLGPTCVQFTGKHLPRLTVSEIDFCSKDSFNTGTVKFKSGKSTLFSLGNICFDDCQLNCEVTLKRKLPEGEDSEYYCFGKNSFCLNQKFINILNSCATEPTSQCLKLSLDMKNQINETVGTVRLLIRLTCFGTVIVTEFQREFGDNKGFLFKGDRVLPAEEESICGINRDSKYLSKDQMQSSRKMSLGLPSLPLSPHINPFHHGSSMQQGFVPPQQVFFPPPQNFAQSQPGAMPLQNGFPPPQSRISQSPPVFNPAMCGLPQNHQSMVGPPVQQYSMPPQMFIPQNFAPPLSPKSASRQQSICYPVKGYF